MAFDVANIIRNAKRLQEATGYFELGMTQQTLECLEGLKDLGPFQAEAATLRSKALRLQRGDDVTAVSVHDEPQAEPIPTPQSKTTWLTLSFCYHMAGNV